MNDILDEFYRRFSHPSPQTDLQREIEDIHRQLIERLEKSERKLVLKIIDAKDMIAGTEAQASFNCGFWLEWRLFMQLNSYDSGRSAEENLSTDGRFSMQKEQTMKIKLKYLAATGAIVLLPGHRPDGHTCGARNSAGGRVERRGGHLNG